MIKVLVDRELLPCPFCGQQDAFVEQLDSDASVVICQGMVDEHSACLARGPVGVQQSEMEDQPGRDAAIAEWNRRAQPAEAEGVVAWAPSTALEKLRNRHNNAPCVLTDGPAEFNDVPLVTLAALSAVTAERDRLADMLSGEVEANIKLREQWHQLSEEVEALRAENERLSQQLAQSDAALRESRANDMENVRTLENMWERHDALRQELEALRKDAERYRWASSGVHEAETLVSIVNCHGGYAEKVAERVDVYRDAAMAEKEA